MTQSRVQFYAWNNLGQQVQKGQRESVSVNPIPAPEPDMAPRTVSIQHNDEPDDPTHVITVRYVDTDTDPA